MNLFETIFKPDPLSDRAYAEIEARVMGCESCSCSPDEFKRRMLDIWNSDLTTRALRVCQICGNTKECRRIKDDINRYGCEECNPEQGLEVPE